MKAAADVLTVAVVRAVVALLRDRQAAPFADGTFKFPVVFPNAAGVTQEEMDRVFKEPE